MDEQESESTYLWTLPLGKCPVVQAARSSKGKQNHHTCCPSQLVCGDASHKVRSRRVEVRSGGTGAASSCRIRSCNPPQL